ncbi:hypothetical protein [Natrialba sp. INN-245]|uniref:hypothetical protein n=1 Tax=Natrialba sp. INN-245 TaxID=2690967 RepID=UPI001310DFD3|nr:hypothetical protein [Natrialba sp. INN-245]MWV40713.1 hypothetical protein [Natrialba sp. INN-245]
MSSDNDTHGNNCYRDDTPSRTGPQIREGTENGPSLATSVSELEASYRARIGEGVFALGLCAGAVPYLLRGVGWL